MAEALRFRPGSQIEILNRHQVRYILVGGVAARVHASIRRTGDVDICPSRADGNPDRLASALNELQARVYVDEQTPAMPMTLDGGFVASQAILNLLTRRGRLNVVWRPAGTDGFDD